MKQVYFKNQDINEIILDRLKSANNTFYDLSKQLTVVGGLLVSLTPALFFNQNTYRMVLINPGLFEAAFGLTIVSILSGLAQLFHDWTAFRKDARSADKLRGLTEKETSVLRKNDRDVDRLLAKEGKSSVRSTGNQWLYLQFASIIIALSFLFFNLHNLLLR